MTKQLSQSGITTMTALLAGAVTFGLILAMGACITAHFEIFDRDEWQ